MRLRSAALLALAASSCASGKEPVSVALAPTILDPQDLFANVTKITLAAIDTSGGADCVAQTGLVTGGDAAHTQATVDLTNVGCASGYRYCGTLTLTESQVDRVFQATGVNASGITVATGCTRATITQSAQTLPTITMVRYIKPANCGDGVVDPTEQCEGMSFYCDGSCHSTEVLLSTGASFNGTTTGKAGDKFDASFLWPSGSGASGRFFAFFTDKTPGQNDLGMRVLSDAWIPVTTPPTAAAGELYLPNNGAVSPPVPAPGSQGAAHGAFLGNKYYVVFQDDDSPNGLDIHLRSMDSGFVADQGVSASIVINGSTGMGEPGIQSLPDISVGANSNLFIAWQDDAAGGVINGRTMTQTPPSTLGTQQKISTGTGSGKVALAALPTGWVAVWESGGDVHMRIMGADGTPAGTESVVNESTTGLQDHPSVAALADGRFAVVFANHAGSGSDIVLQRFDATGAKVAGDQASRVNNVVTDGDQTVPRVAAVTAAGGSFAIAWLDVGTNDVRGRLAGGTTGFLPNSIDGQDQEFKASLAASKTRTNPVVASGGAAGNVIIGWEDTSSTGAGVVGRLFPPPPAQ